MVSHNALLQHAVQIGQLYIPVPLIKLSYLFYITGHCPASDRVEG